jgi:hypothetical protein
MSEKKQTTKSRYADLAEEIRKMGPVKVDLRLNAPKPTGEEMNQAIRALVSGPPQLPREAVYGRSEPPSYVPLRGGVKVQYDPVNALGKLRQAVSAVANQVRRMTPEAVKDFAFGAVTEDPFMVGASPSDIREQRQYLTEHPWASAGMLAALIPTEAVKGLSGAAKAAKRLNVTRNVAGMIESPMALKIGQLIEEGKEGAGAYVGTKSLGWITPERKEQIINRFLKYAEQGKDYRHWYDDLKPELMALTGDEARARQLAYILAETSAGTEIGVNTGFGVKGVNQLATGTPVETGRFPKRMSANIERMAANPEEAVTGLKRSAFGHNMDPTVDANLGDARATHDIRYMRGLDIPDPKTGNLWDKGVSDAAHAFLDTVDDEMVFRANRDALGGVTNWTKPRLQAAAWIAQKAEQDGVTLAEAAASPNQFWDRYAGIIAAEAAPGAISTAKMAQLFPEYAKATPEQQRAFTQQVLGALSSEGRNDITRGMGGLARPDIEQVGTYLTPEHIGEAAVATQNPGRVSPILIAGKKGTVDKASKDLSRGVASVQGLLTGQTQMGVTLPQKVGATPQKKFNGALFNLGRPATDAEQAALMAVVGDAPVMKHPLGMVTLNFVPERNIKARKNLVGQLRTVAQHLGIDPKTDMQLFRNAGRNVTDRATLVPAVAPIPGEGRWAQSYLAQIPEGSQLEASASRTLMTPGGVTDRLIQTITDIPKQFGWSQPPDWYMTMLKTARTEGIPGIRRLAQAGLIPAIAWAMVKPDGEQEQ